MYSLPAELIELISDLSLSPYKILDLCKDKAFDRKCYAALESDDLWLEFIKKYFPCEKALIQKMDNLLHQRRQSSPNTPGNDEDQAKIVSVKAEFIKLAKKMSWKIKHHDCEYFQGREAHASDSYFMSRVLKISKPKEFTSRLKGLCVMNGLLHYVAADTHVLMYLLSSLFVDNDKRLEAIERKAMGGKNILHFAAGSPDSIKALLSLYPDPKARLAAIEGKATEGKNTLHFAAGSLDSIKTLLSFYPAPEARLAAIEIPNLQGRNLLHLAAGSPDSIKALLSLYPNPEARLAAIERKDSRGLNILRLAVGSPDSIKVLLSFYPDEARLAAIERKDFRDENILHFAAGSADSIKALLSFYPNDEARLAAIEGKGDRNKILHLAADSPDSIKALLSFYPNDEARLAAIKTENTFGENTLHLAAGSPDLIKALLSLYPDDKARLAALMKKDRNARSVLAHACCRNKDAQFIEYILSFYAVENRLKGLEDGGCFQRGMLYSLLSAPNVLQYILSFLPDDTSRLELLKGLQFREGRTLLQEANSKSPELFKYILSLYPDGNERQQALQSIDGNGSPVGSFDSRFFGRSKCKEQDQDPGFKEKPSFS